MTAETVTRRVAANTAVQMAARVGVMALGLASIAIATRYLGPRSYGQYALAITYTQLFGIVADIGLFTIVVRELSQRPERAERLVGNSLGLRLVVAVAAMAIAAAVSLLLPYSGRVRLAIVIAGAALIPTLLAAALTALFQARLRMELAAAAQVAGRVVAFGAVAGVAAGGLGFHAVVATATLGAIASLAVSALLARRLVSVRFRADLGVWRELLGASFALGLALAINEVYFRADTFLISLYLPYRDVGLYGVAYRILEFGVALPGLFAATVFAVISRYVEQDAARLRRALDDAWDVCLALGVPIAVGGAILAGPLIALAAGPGFEGAVTTLRILSVAAGLIAVNGLLGFSIIAKGRQASALWLNLVALALNLGLNIILIPRHGIEAAAWVMLGCEVVILACSSMLVRRFFGFGPGLGLVPRALLAAAAMAAVLWPLRHTPALISAPVGAAVYFAALYALAGERRGALKRLRRSPA